MRARVLVVLGFCALTACGAPPAPKSKAASADLLAPHWEDAFDRTPDILVLVRPQAIRRDKVYGALLKTLSGLAQARSPAGAGARSTEAFESADEVIVGLREGEGMVVVVRGVRPDIDPERLGDEQGLPLWIVAHDHARTPELVHDRPQEPVASLFVLPQRTWVLAVGDARERTRDAFASPLGRSLPVRDDHALVLLRLDGPALVRRIPRLEARGGPLQAVGRKLQSLTLVLGPGKEGVIATFAYADEAAAISSESTLGQVVEALNHDKNPRTAWIAAARVVREGRAVRAKVDLPPALLHDLPHASPSDLGLLKAIA